MKTLLLKEVSLNGRVVNVLVRGNRYAAMDAPLQTADETVDCRGKALLPAFYNMHTHAAMNLLRGYADDMPLMTWLTEHIWPYEARLTPRDIYVGSRLAILEMIRSGTVFFNDMYWQEDETLRAADEAGIRAAIGITLMDRLGGEALERAFRRIDNWQPPAHGRITLTVAPHAIYTCNEPLLRRAAEAARQKGLKLHIHLAETRQEVEDCLQLHGTTPVRYLDSIGFLGSDVMAAHVVHVDDHEIRILAERGVTLIHNPASNLKLSSGILRYQALTAAGCRLALGTDGAASNNNLDMREEMKLAALVAKGTHTPETLPAAEALRWATANGAAAVGLHAGTPAEGQLADGILVSLANERLVPGHNLISNWVYAADTRAITDVMCDGRFLMRAGVVPNEADIIREAQMLVRHT